MKNISRAFAGGSTAARRGHAHAQYQPLPKWQRPVLLRSN
jgi:hypothetical protein